MNALIPLLCGLVWIVLVAGAYIIERATARHKTATYGWLGEHERYIAKCQCGYQSDPTDIDTAKYAAADHADGAYLYGPSVGPVWPHEWTEVFDLEQTTKQEIRNYELTRGAF